MMILKQFLESSRPKCQAQLLLSSLLPENPSASNNVEDTHSYSKETNPKTDKDWVAHFLVNFCERMVLDQPQDR